MALFQCSAGPSKDNSVDRPYYIPLPLTAFELYGWSDSGQDFFTIMTLTDEKKSLKEITADNQNINRPQWLRLKVTSLDNIKFILKGLPRKSLVIWKGSPEGYKELNLSKIEKISHYCKKIEIQFELF